MDQQPSDLPNNWYAAQSPDGQTYYYNGITN